LFVKVIEGRLRLLGEKHRDTQGSFTELAKMYTDQGRHDAAEQLLIKTLERRRRLFGDKDRQTQTRLTEILRMYEISGQFDKLKTLFLSNSKMFARQRTELEQGDEVYLNAHARRQATCLVAELRDGPEAIENATKACELTNWKSGRYVGTLAAAYAEAGNFVSAIEWQKKAIDLLTEEGRPLQQPYFESRLKLYESRQPARLSFVRTVAWLHYLYDSRGQFGEVERRLIKALEFSRRVLGEEHSETLACQEDFVTLYEAWGKPEKADEWRAKLPQKEAVEQ
jgi:tetratricopeptide (TPR) repeat protein